MKIALDTNVLVYAEGVNGEAMRVAASDLIDRLPDEGVYVPLQALGELFNVLVGKARLSRRDARLRTLAMRSTFAVIPTTHAVLSAAIDLAAGHGLSIWDAVILAAAASAGCEMLLSEDMQDSFTWSGVTIANPFASTMNPRLRAALGGAGA